MITVSVFIVDINECLNNNGSCSDECVNTEGSYHCKCFTGYTLKPNQRDCEGLLHMYLLQLKATGQKDT